MKLQIWVAGFAVLALTACETGPFKKKSNDPLADLDTAGSQSYEAPLLEGTGLNLSTDSRFQDVPLPQGVKEDLNKSVIFESSSLQFGHMVYHSKASVNELANFYIRECPAADWKLISSFTAAGHELTFTKPGKRLQVHVRDLGVGRSSQLTLRLIPEAGL
jgi:hypothetical protein